MNRRLLIATTTTGYKAKAGEATTWLDNAEKMVDTLGPHVDHVAFFAALQGGGHPDAMASLLYRLGTLGGTWASFMLPPPPDGVIDQAARLAGICAGRNVIIEHANRSGNDFDWVLFLDSDLDVMPTLPVELFATAYWCAEHPWPMVGGDVPVYSLGGPKAGGPPCWAADHVTDDHARYPAGWDVREHWNTAGCLLVGRPVLDRVRWRWSLRDGMTDDPCFAADAYQLGYRTIVRHDVGAWAGEMLLPFDQRGYDLRVGG